MKTRFQTFKWQFLSEGEYFEETRFLVSTTSAMSSWREKIGHFSRANIRIQILCILDRSFKINNSDHATIYIYIYILKKTKKEIHIYLALNS
jgi:hypothetical protein